MAVEGDAADIVTEAGAGYVCVPEDAVAMADRVKKVYDLSTEKRKYLGENGKKFYNSKMSLSHGVRKFELFFESVLRGE
ncbi:MAG: glycosyltransferase family 4 protein [Planctomycetes bacterium]|nr:glycosyltransferase family 4 protein [Planctomycetota bacterium]